MPTGCKTRRGQALCLALAAGIGVFTPGAHAQAEVPVALELILAVDTSISIDHSEFQLQSIGLAEAFRDPDVIAAIQSTGDAGIAVSLVQWGVGLQQKVAVGWSQVRDARSARAFARAIDGIPRYFQGQATGISRALDFSARQFTGDRKSVV